MIDESAEYPAGTAAENTTNWPPCLPRNAGHVRDISDEAVWALSSCKTDGFGIQQLLDERTDQYWQSDGPQPHSVTIEFQRKTDISFLMMYLDYKADESYTPCKIQVQIGSSILDLEDPVTLSFNEPVGWQLIDLRDGTKPMRAFVIVLQILQNHQNGRDTHVRGLKVLGPSKPHLDINQRALAANEVLGRHLKDPVFANNTFNHFQLR
ncbi:anaphase-promoting complex, subunit 10 (APC10) domain-containing protein [Ditylenchus destructor]|uniref:Anaphase-promoting complex subunit 10 n=1 Tax=Ditylenchus destructor TaxID=166010 RepID=A0AAD4R6G0_9BILA|nr:anaphase-promoting complex, subunit 10 (APC10) domain-containing protein [Ditylenchus destructor]